MTIRTRLTLSSVICIALALFLAAFLMLTAQQVREMTEKHRLGDKITNGASELQILTNDYLLHYTERAEMQWYQRHGSITKLLVVGEDPEEKLIFDSISRHHEQIKDIFTQLTASIKEGQQLGSEGTGLYEKQENRLVSQLLIESQMMVSDAYELQLLTQTKLDTFQRRGILSVIGFTSVMAAVIAAFSVLIRRSVLSPLGKLQAGTEKVGSGDLDYRLDIATRDEIGQLSRAFDHMTESLQTTTVSRDRLAEEIIERKLAEENFRNSLDNSPLGTRIVTEGGDLLYANQAMLNIYGYGSFEELKATPAKQRYTPESYTEHWERAEARKLGEPIPDDYEISIVRKDGVVRYLQVFRRQVI